MIDKDFCKRNECWWLFVCKQTRKACTRLQGVDLRWEECPNNKNIKKELSQIPKRKDEVGKN